jgi:hypothetical protein
MTDAPQKPDIGKPKYRWDEKLKAWVVTDWRQVSRGVPHVVKPKGNNT